MESRCNKCGSKLLPKCSLIVIKITYICVMDNKQPENTTFYNFNSFDSWREALSKAPSDKWILTRKIGSGKTSSYLPLFIQQALADLFFREFDVIDGRQEIVVNEIIYNVKISFLPDFPDSEHRFMTGVAAKPIQQDASTSASSFPIGKKSNALEYNAAAARSAAISNALTNFANIFGRNLNRDIRNDYSMEKKIKTEKTDE